MRSFYVLSNHTGKTVPLPDENLYAPPIVRSRGLCIVLVACQSGYSSSQQGISRVEIPIPSPLLSHYTSVMVPPFGRISITACSTILITNLYSFNHPSNRNHLIINLVVFGFVIACMKS